jgi:ribonuclease BN (tRNA processing enzyme)
MRSKITQVVLLGTGTPNADPGRSGPAVAILVQGTPYLVDCGPGVVRQAAAACEAGVTGLAVENLSRVFITHLHSDHTLGYPDLIFTPWVLERPFPLQAYGPRGLASMTAHILEAYREDIRIRTQGLEHADPQGYRVDVHEIAPGLIYEDAHIKVTAFPVRHGNWKEAYGFRFETPDRVIVVSGDTVPCETLKTHAKGCDILIHEVYAKAGFDRRPKGWQDYHASFHTSSLELAEIARETRPGLLVLYHQLFWGTPEDQLLEEIRQVYEGPVCSGRDLDLF